MSLKVVIPTPLRKHTGGLEVIEVDAGTVKEVIDRLESKFPGIRNSVCDDSGGLRRFINVYVDGEDVRFLQNLSTPAKDGSEIAIVPAIQVTALQLAWMAGGVVVVEFVFQYPGIGAALVDAVALRDMPVVQTVTMLAAGIYVGLNLLADIATILVTPKLRTAGR